MEACSTLCSRSAALSGDPGDCQLRWDMDFPDLNLSSDISQTSPEIILASV